jgi:hypothetical protein
MQLSNATHIIDRWQRLKSDWVRAIERSNARQRQLVLFNFKANSARMQSSHDAQRANEYRSRAAEMKRQAETVQDTRIKDGFLSIAETYLRMAEHIEKGAAPAKWVCVRFRTEPALALNLRNRKIWRAMADGATPINKFALFEPGQVREIVKAFDEACQSLPQPVPDAVRAVLAKHITENAQRGQLSREKLRDEALAHLKSFLEKLDQLNPQERASEYRELANELFVEAGSEKDGELRAQLIDMANACLLIAKRIEILAGIGPQTN